MSAAQKRAQDNFKKAIAYRKKTGVSLKEAFAHVKSGKKVGAIKKKTSTKKPSEKAILKKVHSAKTSSKTLFNKLDKLDEAQHKHMSGNVNIPQKLNAEYRSLFTDEIMLNGLLFDKKQKFNKSPEQSRNINKAIRYYKTKIINTKKNIILLKKMI